MRQPPTRFPTAAALFEDAPELAPLAILEVALLVCEASLLAANPELLHGQLDGHQRGSSAMRANTLIVQARRLSTALAAYRDAVDREARRQDRERESQGF